MKKRALLLLAVICLLSAVLSACGSEFVPSGHLRLKGKDVETDWVIKLDGEEISADEYRYFFMNVAHEYTYTAEGEYEWTEADNEAVLGAALEYAVLNKAMFDLAEGFGLTVDEADLERIEDTIKETKAGFGDKAEFIEVLASNYITEEYYPTLLQSTVIQEKLSEYLTGENGVYAVTKEGIVDIIMEDYICVRYLKLSPDAEGSTENRDKMAGFAADIKAAEDLITLINLYSEEVTMKNNPDGRYITEGLVDGELISAARALSVGEISPVVSCESGYYIVLRLPMDESYIAKNADAFIQTYHNQVVKELLAAESADTLVEYNEDIYGKINVWDME